MSKPYSHVRFRWWDTVDLEKASEELKSYEVKKVEPLLDWEAFRPIIQPMYRNQGPSGGRPNMDPVLMVKLLVLQAWYGLSDPDLERQASIRIDFMHFLGYPEKAPDYSTV